MKTETSCRIRTDATIAREGLWDILYSLFPVAAVVAAVAAVTPWANAQSQLPTFPNGGCGPAWRGAQPKPRRERKQPIWRGRHLAERCVGRRHLRQ